MNKTIYLKELEVLKRSMMNVKNTPFTVFAKVASLVLMNMRYEKIAFDIKLKAHPFILTRDIIRQAICHFRAWIDISFIESDDISLTGFKDRQLEKKHAKLWQEIWSRHSNSEFREFIELKKSRLKINHLIPHIKGKKCIDFGCGNGSFAFAMLELGARSVVGIDFGEENILYAKQYARKHCLKSTARFYVANVLDHPLPSDAFDFAVSNGVFHHLKATQISQALKAVASALRAGGWFWYYIDGKGAISMDLFDCSVDILKDVDLSMIEAILKCMNIKRNKMVHLMDGMNATYIHSTYDDTVKMLTRSGFGNFRRLIGGASTDFDHDRIAGDRFGREKFGEGDLRIACQRVKKPRAP